MRAQAAALLTAVAMALTTVTWAPASQALTPALDPTVVDDRSQDGRGAEQPGAAAEPGAPEDPGAAADRALAEATALFEGHDAHARRTPSTDVAEAPTADATMVLRELRMRFSDLSRSEQAVASVLLSRPTTAGPPDRGDPFDIRYDGPSSHHCSTHLCVHWETPAPSSPAPPDADANGVPDQLDLTSATFEEVWGQVVGRLGYRAPLGDQTSPDGGPNSLLDVYVLDLPNTVYGFCTSDDPSTGRAGSGYCVVDDDYSEFAGSPVESLRVTAAHEFFHVVQFAYDWDEDVWLMEGTAAWVEDEVYDSVDDNRQYLGASALAVPNAPVDFVDGPGYAYGSWIFWRYLSESMVPGPASDPRVVRQVWERAAAGEYSLLAVRRVLASRGRSFGRTFAAFGAANLTAKRSYDEGRAYPQARPIRRFTLENRRRGTGSWVVSLNHLSNASVVVRQGSTLRGSWRLQLSVDLPLRLRGSEATVLVYRRDGALRRLPVTLNNKGNATVTVPFSRRTVSAVSLTLTNASTRMAGCGSGTTWSCGGQSKDDGLPFVFAARAVR